MPTFSPLSDQVLVRRLAAEERSKGGLYIPDRAKEKPLEGIVVATGPGRLEPVWGGARDGAHLERVPCQVRSGDRVLFRKYGGTELTFDDQECIIVEEREILGVISEG